MIESRAGEAPGPAKILLLHPEDTVLVCIDTIVAGDTLWIDGQPVSAPQPCTVGHKLARRALAVGDKVLKYGAPIGSMTSSAVPGEHVHAHNMKSDYIRSHTRQDTGGRSHV